MKVIKLVSILLLATLLISACGASRSMNVQNIWARPASVGENGAAYFVIENNTAKADTLLSVSSDIATATEVHMSMADGNGVMSMQMQESTLIPAKELVEFKPGGLHVMFVNLKQDLRVGDTIVLTLNFKELGSITVEVPVQEP